MKRIAHIIDTLDMDGAQRIVYDLVNGLPKEEFAQEVIVLKGEKSQHYVNVFREMGVEVTLLQKKTRFGRKLLRDLVSVLREKKLDIVHTHLFTADVWGSKAAHIAGVRQIISTEHNINTNLGARYHWFKRRANKRFTTIVAISDAVADYIRQYDKHAAEKVQRIYNGVDLARFETASQNHDITKNTPPTMAIVGRLEPQKGHIPFLDVLAEVEADYRLSIIGEGSLYTKIEQHIQVLGLSEKVTLEGAREDIENVYGETDIVVIPSLFEGFGLVAVEAMASGCLVVASATGGLHEIVGDEEYGMLIDLSMPGWARKEITLALESAEHRASLAKQGQQRAQDFSLQSMLQHYTELYNSTNV